MAEGERPLRRRRPEERRQRLVRVRRVALALYRLDVTLHCRIVKWEHDIPVFALEHLVGRLYVDKVLVHSNFLPTPQ